MSDPVAVDPPAATEQADTPGPQAGDAHPSASSDPQPTPGPTPVPDSPSTSAVYLEHKKTTSTGPSAEVPSATPAPLSNGIPNGALSVQKAQTSLSTGPIAPAQDTPTSAPVAPKQVPEYDPSIVIGGQAHGRIEISFPQIKFLQNVIKALKGRTEAKPFLAPVDPIAAGVPHYHTIITHPMDLGTIDMKLALTAAAVKGGNKPTEKVKAAPRWGLDIRSDVYLHVKDFVDEVRLTFNNTRLFNGPLHLISLNADALESVFDKQMKTFPSSEASQRRTPAGVDTSLRMPERPKREIHPPPPRDIVYDDLPTGQPKRKNKKANAALTPAEATHWEREAAAELKFCGKVVEELFKPSHSDIAWVFYDLPDKDLDYAPAYYAMIKHPISLTGLQQRLRTGEYADADEFDADIQLLFRNCFTFNPPGSDVYIMGQKLKAVYDRTFAKRPESKPFVPEILDEPPSEQRMLAQALREQAHRLSLEADEVDVPKPSQRALAQARATLALLDTVPESVPSPGYAGSATGQKRRKSVANVDGPKKSSAKRPRKSAPARSVSAGPVDEAGPSAPPKKPAPKRARKPKPSDLGSDDDDIRVVTYEQKEELATKITTLPEDRLEGALRIISEDKPGSADLEEEIELDIDDLSPRTLYKLYRYVVRPKDKKTTHSKPVKNANDGRKRGTGGLKGKTLDESEETERIQRLQAQLQQFDTDLPAPAAHDDLVNSDSSNSDSDLSGDEDF